MFRSATGQLVLVALTACVGAHSSGFLKPQGSSKLRNISPVVSVLQQDPPLNETVAKQAAEIKSLRMQLPHGGYKNTSEEKKAVYKEANTNEDAALSKAWTALETRHQKETAEAQVAMDRYDTVLTKRYACNDDYVRTALKAKIAKQRKITTQSLYIKQAQEKKIFLSRQKCMQKENGDQSNETWNWNSAYIRDFGNDTDYVSANQSRANVATCMKTAQLVETSPVANEALTLSEEAAVQTQINRYPEMLEQAMNGALKGVFNIEQRHEQKQLEDTWEIDTKEFKQCEEKEAKALDVKQNVVKADSQKVDVKKPTTIASQFKDALADAKNIIAEASEAVTKKDDV